MPGSESWQRGPWQLISHTQNKEQDSRGGLQQMVNDMIVIHNITIRSINAIYHQSKTVAALGSPKDITDFLEYCSVWEIFIHGHHDEEEQFVFPSIERLAGEPGLMAGNIKQHREFHDGLEKFRSYVDLVKSGKETLDGQKLIELIDSFMPVLHKHLQEEISTLKSLDKFEQVDWRKFWAETSAKIIKKQQANSASAPVILPFALSGQDNTFEGGVYQWPPLPWVLKQVFKWWFIPKHKDWWRFAPCDSNSQPRELLFASK